MPSPHESLPGVRKSMVPRIKVRNVINSNVKNINIYVLAKIFRYGTNLNKTNKSFRKFNVKWNNWQ